MRKTTGDAGGVEHGCSQTEAEAEVAGPASPATPLAGELANFLTTIAIRAANYTACRLDDWLTSQPRLWRNTASASHVSEITAHRRGWPAIEVASNDRDKSRSNLSAESSRELDGVSCDG